MKPANPPTLPTKLLESFVPQRTSEALLGDLIEQYEAGRSRTWYWQQVILALAISAGRELRASKLHAARAVVIGSLTGASLSYFTTLLAGRFVGRFVGVYTTYYLVFLPLSFFSFAASGWIVRRSHPRAMVLIWAGFCVVASVVAFAVCAWLSILAQIPAPIVVFFLVLDFIIGPLGVLAGGLWGSSDTDNASYDTHRKRTETSYTPLRRSG